MFGLWELNSFILFLPNNSFQFDNYEIRKGKQLKVNISVPNVRLFIGNIPKEMSRENIIQEFHKHTSESALELNQS